MTPAEVETLAQRAIDTYAGHWSLRDGALEIRGGSGNGDVGLSVKGADWTDYTMAFDLTLIDTTKAIGYSQGGWAFRAKDPGNCYVWLLSDRKLGQPDKPGYLTRAVFVNGALASVTTVALSTTITPGKTYRVQTVVNGTKITTSVDGTVIDTITNSQFAKGKVGFREAGGESARYDNLLVTDASGRTLLRDDFSDGLGAFTAPPGSHPSFAGIVVYDEPSDAKAGDVGAVVAALKKVAPQYFPYVNLLPGLSQQQYDDQTAKIDAPIVSFDRYPILTDRKLDTGYYENWARVRHTALATKKPAWTFIQSVAYNGHAVPREEDLLWQVNVSLAFGCRGIQYFTWWTPDPARGEGFHDGIISTDGKRTSLYEAAKRVNTRWLSPVGHELASKPSEAVYGANLNPLPAGLDPIDKDPDVASVTGLGVVIGRFGAGDGPAGSRHLLVVNNSNTTAGTARIRFATTVRTAEKFDPRGRRWLRTETGRGISLTAGAAVLLRLQ